MNAKKIVLGTAQFGMDYGINNNRGRIPPEEVFKILLEAVALGVGMLILPALMGKLRRVLVVLLINIPVN
jgi:hypothetical protein